MKCGLCGNEFDETSGKASCPSCPVSRGCNLLKCPNCGYEMPVTPVWLEKIRNIFMAGSKKQEKK